jgi:hypothetical protein
MDDNKNNLLLRRLVEEMYTDHKELELATLVVMQEHNVGPYVVRWFHSRVRACAP